MAWEIVASGGVSSLGGIHSYEAEYAEGQLGLIEIKLRFLPPGTANSVRFILEHSPGINLPDLRVWSESRFGGLAGGTLFIQFRKGGAQLVIIIAALAAILVMVTAWTLFREPIQQISENIPAVVAGIGGLVALGVILYLAGGRRGKRET